MKFHYWLISCSICVLDFPHCVVHEMPELTAESLVSENRLIPAGFIGFCRRDSDPVVSFQEAGDNNQFCWRNLFSCINLLRILNKLTKWKHSRTMVRSGRCSRCAKKLLLSLNFCCWLMCHLFPWTQFNDNLSRRKNGKNA